MNVEHNPNVRMVLNPNSDLVHKITDRIAKCQGFCPCQPIDAEKDTRCPCPDFYQGNCHCNLFVRSDVKEESNHMKIEFPSYTIRKIPSSSDSLAVAKYLEDIARTCYQSDDKIGLNSYQPLLRNLWINKHTAMLEHYIVHLMVNQYVFDSMYSMQWFEPENVDIARAIRYIRCSRIDSDVRWSCGYNPDDPLTVSIDNYYLVSGSFTAFVNCLEALALDQYQGDSAYHHIGKMLWDSFPEVCQDCPTLQKLSNYVPDPDSSIRLVHTDELKAFPEPILRKHDWMSVTFRMDRGVTHELVRHRDASFAHESTRYCNYVNGKFGGAIMVAQPCFFDTGMGLLSNSFVYDEWKRACERCNDAYIKLVSEYGATPQQARTVLPNSLISTITMTAYWDEWRHVFQLRCAKDAHPQMREIMVPLLMDCLNHHPDHINDIYDALSEKGALEV